MRLIDLIFWEAGGRRLRFLDMWDLMLHIATGHKLKFTMSMSTRKNSGLSIQTFLVFQGKDDFLDLSSLDCLTSSKFIDDISPNHFHIQLVNKQCCFVYLDVFCYGIPLSIHILNTLELMLAVFRP